MRFVEDLKNQEFKKSLQYLIEALDFDIRPICGNRSPIEQARLWRQSRTIEQITRVVEKLDVIGAPFLAKCIRDVGPQYGKWATDALPGRSKHQWGMAMDFMWVVDGKAEWSTRRGGDSNGYRILGERAKEFGLRNLKKDPGHVELVQPITSMLSEVNKSMIDIWG